jgi:predicted nuclease with TOPRIM domain
LNKASAELEKLREKVKTLSAENTQLNMKYNSLGSEVGKLRKQVREFSEGRLPNGLTIVQKQAAEFKKLKMIATTGYINPIAFCFSTLKKGLVEHRWAPFVRSLFTELQEAVRRNDFEEICEIHDRMQSFAEAFDNELKERIEKAEKEIIKQCEEGVHRLLSTMF